MWQLACIVKAQSWTRTVRQRSRKARRPSGGQQCRKHMERFTVCMWNLEIEQFSAGWKPSHRRSWRLNGGSAKGGGPTWSNPASGGTQPINARMHVCLPACLHTFLQMEKTSVAYFPPTNSPISTGSCAVLLRSLPAAACRCPALPPAPARRCRLPPSMPHPLPTRS